MSTPKDNAGYTPIRDAINERIESLGISRYDFAHSGKVKAAPSTVYRFLNGQIDSSSAFLDEMLKALGLKLWPTKRPAWARKAKQVRTDRKRRNEPK